MVSLRRLLRASRANRLAWNVPLPGLQDVPSRSLLPGLHETAAFGSNPGNLRMFSYVPSALADDAPLVVVLHGCTQNGASYNYDAGWSTLADRYGFALLFPEQLQSNNAYGCFNWFQTSDTQRGRGEALSIRQMIETLVVDRQLDRRRVFITGLSAGGAMTSVMLACYPDVFAGGAIIAGLPYGAASNAQQAFEIMLQCPSRSARAWGDLVRKAAPRKGPPPRVSVWHGSADKTVIPTNAREIVKQWTDVHRLPLSPSVEEIVEGHRRQAWLDERGEEVIESWTIADMAHGTPLAAGADHDQCGAPGPLAFEVGLSSSYRIARFFGIADGLAPARAESVIRLAVQTPFEADGETDSDAARPPLDGDIIPPGVDIPPPFERNADVQGFVERTISNALKAAGLMKGDDVKG